MEVAYYKKKGDNAFEISVVDGAHTCINPVLSIDYRKLDSTMLAKAVDNYVRDVPNLVVSRVHIVIAYKFNYDFTCKRAFEAKTRL